MKLVVNSAYGYLAAGGGLTRFADVHAANEVTRRGRETLDLMCRALAAARRDAARGGHRRRVLRRAGIVDRGGRAARRRRGGRAAAAARAARVRGPLRGDAVARAEELRAARLRRHAACCAASRSARAAPSRSARRSCGARSAACSRATSPACAPPTSTRSLALRRRELPTHDVSSRVRLTQDAGAVSGETRDSRRELPYEATARERAPIVDVGERVRVYRTQPAAVGVVAGSGRRGTPGSDRRPRATTTSSTTSGCCATRSRRAWPARSRRTTTPRCSPIPSSHRSLHLPSLPFDPCSRRASPRPGPSSRRIRPTPDQTCRYLLTSTRGR